MASSRAAGALRWRCELGAEEDGVSCGPQRSHLWRHRFDEAAIHRQMFPLHQSHFHTLLHDLFEQLLEQFRFLNRPWRFFVNVE